MSDADTESSRPAAETREPSAAWRTNLGLFLLTAVSVFLTGTLAFPKDASPDDKVTPFLASFTPVALRNGAQFAGTLLTILLAHEFGHYIAARIHKVDASLPYFIPMPILSPFGTMGAVIRMRGTIPTRRALLDIGAAGPLAGLAFALPLYAWGVAHSHFVPGTGENLVNLGESVLIKAFDRAFAPPVPDGMLLVYSPVAFGAWGGLFVTMINLLPVGQLDGGHVAYALFGSKQDRYAPVVHRAMLAFFAVILVGHIGRDFAAGRGLSLVYVGRHIGNALFWLVWFEVLAILGSIAGKGSGKREGVDGETPTLTVRTRIVATLGLAVLASVAREKPSLLVVGSFFAGLGMLIAMEIKGGALRSHDLLDHPPAGNEGLDGARKFVAIATLIMFALLFMPEPFSL